MSNSEPVVSLRVQGHFAQPPATIRHPFRMVVGLGNGSAAVCFWIYMVELVPDEPLPAEPVVPTAGRLLGVDYGTKRLGFAVCNAEQTIASPVENYDRQSPVVDAKCVKRLVSEYRVVGLVVGLPIHLSGQDSQKSRESRTFGAWLHQITGLPVAFADERYSSAFAEEHLMSLSFTKKKRKARLDMLAAQAILQGYLESHRGTDPGALSDR